METVSLPSAVSQTGCWSRAERVSDAPGAARDQTIDLTLRSASVAFGNNLGEKSPARSYDD